MNKKGFTLIEIIVCIIIVATIGVSSIVIINNNSVDENINKKILEAANIFVEVEKDENGNNYLEEIVKGAKGVKIPVSMLINKGYINKDIEKELYKNTPKKDNESYYIMFLSDGTDYCDKNEITALASWMEEGKTVYLCNKYNKESVSDNIISINENTKFEVDLTKHAVLEEFYNNAKEDNKQYLTKDENGLYTYYNEALKKKYTYYRGAVNNNYLKLGSDKNGNDLIWRILWYNNLKQLKLVLDDEINLSLTNKNNEEILINNGDYLRDYSYDSYNKYYILNPKEEYKDATTISNPKNHCVWREEDTGECKYYKVNYEEKNIFSDMITLDEDMNNDNNIYFKTLINWYNSTTLNTYGFVTRENNFCKNNYYRDGTNINTYYPIKHFDCLYGEVQGSSNYTDSKLFYSSPVGYVTYGEAMRAGLTTAKNDIKINESKNFLLSKNNNYYPLVDLAEIKFTRFDYGYKEYTWDYYYISESGISTGEFYKVFRNYGRQVTGYYDTYYVLGDDYFQNNGSHGIPIETTTFHANSVKPAIVIDMSKNKLFGDGTIDNPYVIN